MERQMIRQIRTLAHKECCNYIDGTCIYHGNCTVINPRYASIHDGAIDCDDMIRPDERTCACCGAAFVPGSSRQQYCPHCKPRHEQLRNRDKQRSYNQRKQANKT